VLRGAQQLLGRPRAAEVVQQSGKVRVILIPAPAACQVASHVRDAPAVRQQTCRHTLLDQAVGLGDVDHELE